MTRLAPLCRDIQACTRCPLYKDATQGVCGEGPARAKLMLVGEQPGDQEDRQGHPFVGPAGAVLWRCVEEAGLDPAALYVTNAVKHFKHERQGKRRLHKKPSTAEVKACHPWLEAELEAVRAEVVVALGATAARSVLGRTVAIGASRGQALAAGDRTAFVTFHPSAVLRASDDAAEIRAALVEDLRAAAAATG